MNSSTSKKTQVGDPSLPPKTTIEAKKAKTAHPAIPKRQQSQDAAPPAASSAKSDEPPAFVVAAAAAVVDDQPLEVTVETPSATSSKKTSFPHPSLPLQATTASGTAPEKKKRGSERNYVNGILMVKCQCRNPKDCRRIVTFWCQPPNDNSGSKHRDGRRAGYIELPHNRRIEKTVLHEFENQRRERFFKYLTGGTSSVETKTKKQTRDYVALHHFPIEVLNADGSGLTQETVNAQEALELGLTQDDRVTVQGYLSGVSFEGQYIVVPNYPWKNLVEEYLALGGDPKELQGNLSIRAVDKDSITLMHPTTASGNSPPPGNTALPLSRPLAAAALKADGGHVGYDRVALLEARLEHKDARIAEQDARIQEQDKRIQEQDARIAEQDKRIQELESWTGVTAISATQVVTQPPAPSGDCMEGNDGEGAGGGAASPDVNNKKRKINGPVTQD